MELYEPLKQSAFSAMQKQFPESLLSLQQTFNNPRQTYIQINLM